ncbi:MAG: hypothetical protein ACE145_14505 [Terriglobia bacterium]
MRRNRLSLAALRAPGVQPFRVVIREHELFDAGKGQGVQRVRRLVYADAVELGGLKF